MSANAEAAEVTREALRLVDEALASLRRTCSDKDFLLLAEGPLALRERLRRDFDRQLGLPEAPSTAGVHIRIRLDSDTPHPPELAPLFGRTVDIVVTDAGP